MSDLSKWINPDYLRAYEADRLHETYCGVAPFKHAVLQNFFLPGVLERIEAYCRSVPVEKARTDGLARNADWYWGAFADMEVVKFVFGKSFRKFLNTLMGEELTMKATSIPQYNQFRPGSRGIPIHNDWTTDRVGAVLLLQLSKGYEDGFGGELNLIKRENGAMEVFRKVEPRANTLILFKVSPISFHSVSDMQGTWLRENIAFDWYLKDNAVA